MNPCIKNLGIGELFVSREPAIVDTILGSCVSVFLFSVQEKVGGVIHYALPDRSYAASGDRKDLHFGDLAIRALITEVRRQLSSKNSPLQAKVVGGARVLENVQHSNAIGDLNVQTALKVLAEESIPVVGTHVGGSHGRKVYFYTDSARVRVSTLDEGRRNSIPSSVVTPSPMPVGPPRFTAPAAAPAPVTRAKTRVLIVDDSKTIRELLAKILTSEQTEVIGTASNPVEAEPLILKLRPDVITLDISMPVMDGVTFLEAFLPKHFFPVVMVSSISPEESDLVFRALEIGAIDYIQKPHYAELAQQALTIREKVVSAAQSKPQKKSIFKNFGPRRESTLRNVHTNEKILFIGASTGGTEALKEVLTRLPADVPPILIVQHIPPVFSTAFAKRLNELCPFEVKEAEDGDEVLQGRALIAPGGRQMEIVRRGSHFRVRVFDGEKSSGHRPSVDVLFRSAAAQVGSSALGVILTGMGSDGARGMLEMRQRGARTMTQDERSCVVYGMPKAAFELGASDESHALLKIPEILERWIHAKSS